MTSRVSIMEQQFKQVDSKVEQMNSSVTEKFEKMNSGIESLHSLFREVLNKKSDEHLNRDQGGAP